MNRLMRTAMVLALFVVASASADDALKQDPKITAIIRKLEHIHMDPPMVENASVADACRWIELHSKEADPSHEGVTISLEVASTRQLSDKQLMDPKMFVDPLWAEKRKTLCLRNVALGQIIKFVAMTVDLRYRIEPDRVVIYRAPEDQTAKQSTNAVHRTSHPR